MSVHAIILPTPILDSVSLPSTVAMRILPSVARRTRTSLRRLLASYMRPRRMLLLCLALTLVHYGLYRWLHARYQLVSSILHATSTAPTSETAGSASNLADTAAKSSVSPAPFSSLSSFWTSLPALQHRTSGGFLKESVFAFQGGVVTTPADSFFEEEREREARRFWAGLRRTMWYLRAAELVATGMWGLGVVGIWWVSSSG